VLACLGVFASYLPVVGVSVALPVIQQGLGATTTGLEWITDAFVLPTAALLLTFGTIGDRFGRKKTYLSGLALTTVGSLVALTAGSVVQVCVGQALTGIGTAALLPSTLALIGHVCPDKHTRARMIAWWTVSLGLGLTVGQVLSGVIVAHVSWRWIFLPTLAVSVVSIVAGAFVLAGSRAERQARLDVRGQVLAIAMITGLVYGVIEAGLVGWGDVQVEVSFAVAAVALVAFIVAELHSSSPMLDMRLFRSMVFSGAAVVMTLTLFAQIGLVFSLSEYFGLVDHVSTLDIGLRLLPLNGLTVVAGPVVARLMNRISHGLLLVVGLVIAGIGGLLVSVFDASTGTGTIVLVVAVLGLGLSVALAPVTSIAVHSVPREVAATAGSANSSLRQIGSALGPAIFGVILTDRVLATLAGHLAASGLSPASQGEVSGIVHGAGIQAGAFLRLKTAQTTAQAVGAYDASFTDALHTCALIGGIGMLAAAATALVFIGVRVHAAHPTEASAVTHPAGASAVRQPFRESRSANGASTGRHRRTGEEPGGGPDPGGP
jgi:EmrB/QacA subfamily drug resistance transporter